MDKNGKESALGMCLSLIEDKLHWGDSAHWTNYDFEKLSDEVDLATGVRLSVTTLKRIWGKLKYESDPTLTTLNTLAQYAGYADWRSFCHSDQHRTNEAPLIDPMHVLRVNPIQWKSRLFWFLLLLSVIASTYALTSINTKKRVAGGANDSSFSFRANKVVTEGVPNSVVFHYDARAAKTDSVFIVQTWDSKRKRKVSKAQQVHSAIYYYPGYFRTKLIADDQVVRTHDLQITSDGWLCLAESEGMPLYFKKKECVKNGGIEINEAVLKKYQLSLHPQAPRIRIFNQRDFKDLRNDNFTFETSVKNDFKAGTNACQYMQVLIQCKNDVIILPLTAKACVGKLSLSVCGTVVNSENADLSGFGADLSRWTKLRVEAVNRNLTIYVNDAKVYSLSFKHEPAAIVGLQYRFNGTGAVRETRFVAAGKVIEL
jgi:hypothetical protein